MVPEKTCSLKTPTWPVPTWTANLVFLAGASGRAALRAKKANNLLRLQNGDWAKLWTPTPDAKEVRLYVGPDRSQQTIAQQRKCKKISDSLAKTHPSLHFRVVKNHFTVFSGWTPIAKAVAPEVHVEHRGYSAELSLDKTATLAEFELSVASTRLNTQWSL